MTIYDIQEQLSRLDPAMETSAGEVKVLNMDNNYRRLAFIPVSQYEVNCLLKGFVETLGKDEVIRLINLNYSGLFTIESGIVESDREATD
jgi:hypothetical protein